MTIRSNEELQKELEECLHVLFKTSKCNAPQAVVDKAQLQVDLLMELSDRRKGVIK